MTKDTFGFGASEVSRRKFIRSGGALTGVALLGGSTILASCAQPTESSTTTGATTTTASGATTTTAGSTTTAAATGAPKRGGTLRAGIQGGSSRDTLDSMRMFTIPDVARRFQLYEGLVEYDADFQPALVLAEELVPDADLLGWVIRLREGVLFHNGKPLTADDVIFSLQRLLDPTNPGNSASSLNFVDFNDMTKLDDRTVRLGMTRPSPNLPHPLCEKGVIIVPVGFDPMSPIGTGPFVYQSFTPSQQSVFVRNHNYWREGEPYVDEVVIIDFPDAAARYNALISGQVDMIDGLPLAQVDAARATAGLQILEAETGRYMPLVMGCDTAPFDDVRVRQAFRLIIDRPQALDLALNGFGRVGNDLFCPDDPCYAGDLPQRTQDLDQARALLEEAGMDGLTVELVVSDFAVGVLELAQVFAEQAKGAGVNVQVNKVDTSVHFGENYTKWPFSIDLWPPKDLLTQMSLALDPESSLWIDRFQDEQFLSVYRQAAIEPDDVKRCDLLKEAQGIYHDRGGYIIPFFTNVFDAYSERVRGIVAHKANPLSSYYLRSMWIE